MDHETQSNDGEIDSLVRGMVEAMSDSGDKPVPMATTEADEVVKAQLTENTGRHLLDSGGAYGRHWEENQDNPPWKQPAWDVNDGWVTHNVYDFMVGTFDRDRLCVALETALYAYSYTAERKRAAWLRCAESFADAILGRELSAPMLRSLGVGEFADGVIGYQSEVSGGAYRDGPAGSSTYNTYNGEFHTLSQCLQGVSIGGPYAEYVIMQVHGGCDILGGYTAPRVYNTWGEAWIPMEYNYYCENCGWSDAESCVYRDDSVIYQPSIDPFELEDEGLIDEGDDEHPALESAYQSEDGGHISGAVFHKCGDGGLGYVTVR